MTVFLKAAATVLLKTDIAMNLQHTLQVSKHYFSSGTRTLPEAMNAKCLCNLLNNTDGKVAVK
jgi:hypothetical protein